MLSVLETIRIPLMIEPHVCGWREQLGGCEGREHWALDGAVGKWELMDGLEIGCQVETLPWSRGKF